MSVVAAEGVVANGVACGIKASGDKDLALVATADGAPVVISFSPEDMQVYPISGRTDSPDLVGAP